MCNEELHIVYLGLGTNLGAKEKNILDAIANIQKRVGDVVAYSAFYVTEPIGFKSDNMFVNAVCKLQTSLPPLDILNLTQQIELEMGRSTKSVDKVYTDRIIDIDLLMYDDLIFEHEALILPHPHLHERSFVIVPFAEIADELRHPILQKTIGELAADLKGQ